LVAELGKIDDDDVVRAEVGGLAEARHDLGARKDKTINLGNLPPAAAAPAAAAATTAPKGAAAAPAAAKAKTAAPAKK
jgi:hypothetical protein